MFNITSPVADFLYNLFNTGVILGALLVLGSTIGTVWTGGVKERYSDERIAANETETARANERAARLEKEAQESRERALNAELRISELNLTLEQMRQRRHLTESQLQELTRTLSEFKSVGFDCAANVGDAEARFILASLMEVMTDAGWIGKPWQGRGNTHVISPFPAFGEVTEDDVVIVFDISSEDQIQKGALLLSDKLNSFGVEAMLKPVSTEMILDRMPLADKNTIHILVGKKMP